MKKSILALATAAMLATSCQDAARQQIEAAAQGYLDAMGNYLIEDAAPYATRQTRERTIPTLCTMMAHADTAYINSNRPAEISIRSSRMLNDTSAVVYYHKSTPIKEVDDSVKVLLEEGKWLVDVQLAPLPIPNLSMDSTRRRHIRIPNGPIRRIPKDSIPADLLPIRQK